MKSTVRTYRLLLCGPVKTPLWSDTLWGHVAWAIRLLWGEKTLREFLEATTAAKKEEEFPFIFSSVFPEGFLPLPAFPLVEGDSGEDTEATSSSLAEKKKAARLAKAIRQIALISADAFVTHCLSWNESEVRHLLHQMVSDGTARRLQELFMTYDIPHCTIDRLSGTVCHEGGLFVIEKSFPLGSGDSPCGFWFFVKVGEGEWGVLLDEILTFIGERGFGADASTGNGAFVIEPLETPPWLTTPLERPESFISLSHAVSSVPRYYRVVTKYGKTYLPLAEGEPPFKQPIFLLEPGAVLDETAPHYLDEGVLRGIHRNSAIIHYAVPFLLPLAKGVAHD